MTCGIPTEVHDTDRESGKSDQDSAISDMDLQQRVADMRQKRKEQDDERFRSMEEHPRCAILPSPEKLDESIGSPGSDKTDTLRDFDLIKKWVTESKLLNTGFYDWAGTDGEDLDDGVYYSFIRLSFSDAFDAMRNTASPELEELVFWYYGGHGLSKEADQLSYLSTPCLDRVQMIPGYHEAADKFVKEGRKVKGGELCLHKAGFCDLYGLLKPWIAAVKAPSISAGRCSKKNKHLVIVLDSCYSGIIAQELKVFEDEMNTKEPSFLQENSVTIQAACGPDQGALGGYFTPCFVYLNDPKKAELLNELKSKWNDMTEEERNEYKLLELQSPMVVTTKSPSQDSHDVTMELTIQNFKLTLFTDPGFFKFCYIKINQGEGLFIGEARALTVDLAEAFMKSRPFTVLDYKLKTLANGSFAGTPMGLFLLEDRQTLGDMYTVCAHIHFKSGDTSKYQRINLVHHKKPHEGITPFLYPYREEGAKDEVPLDQNAQDLVQACYDFVENRKQGTWINFSQWNMTGFGVSGLFRMQELRDQRSAWEDSYLKHIEGFKIPTVQSNV